MDPRVGYENTRVEGPLVNRGWGWVAYWREQVRRRREIIEVR